MRCSATNVSRASKTRSSENTAVGGQCSCTRSSTSTPRFARLRSAQSRKAARVNASGTCGSARLPIFVATVRGASGRPARSRGIHSGGLPGLGGPQPGQPWGRGARPCSAALSADAGVSEDRVFDALDTLVQEQRIAAYGVSVETCEEALTAIARPNVATVQLILNVFRRKPLERVMPAALQAGVGVIARVPLASGLLSGRYGESTTFAPEDHRTYNRQGEAFDVGETFSGVPFEVGVRAARNVAAHAKGFTTAQLALRWILDQPGVSTVIPGARNASQVKSNAAAAEIEPLSGEVLDALRAIYDAEIREHVQDRW